MTEDDARLLTEIRSKWGDQHPMPFVLRLLDEANAKLARLQESTVAEERAAGTESTVNDERAVENESTVPDARERARKNKHIGFTGTRNGMTPPQAEAVQGLFPAGGFILHHGDCVGADAQAHFLALASGGGVLLHPPSSTTHRAFCEGTAMDPPLPYMVRNQRIVATVALLIAAPSGPETRRSGTWTTVRMARKVGLPRIIVYPDGKVHYDDGPVRD